MPLGEKLIAKGIISKDTLDKALDEQKKNAGVRLGDILIKMGAATKEQVEASL